MSYILEALRKSERERQNRQTPDLNAVVAGATAPRRALLPWVLVGVLVAVNGIALGFFLLHDRQPGTTELHRDPPPSPRPAEATPPPAPQPESTSTIELKAGPAMRPPVKEVEPALVTPPPEKERGETTVRSEPKHQPAAKPIEKPRPQRPTEAPDEILDEPDPETTNSKPYRINVLAYSAAPDERFAIINMSKYTKGDRLPDGAVVEEIEQDGVVLSKHGKIIRVAH